ncbi:MAG: hypothetical protein J5649_02960 [Lachnospiraceae bacterium]|nr:hypothetical protein [Lachnospiraceae bacterium]
MGLFDKLFGRKKPEDNETGGKPAGNKQGGKNGTDGAPVINEAAGKNAQSGNDRNSAAKSEYAGNTLVKYEYHYGGNMNGNSHRETVEAVDDAHARISIEHAEWYCEDPKVDEYLVDISIMEELKEVFCRYCMEQWHNREFTDEFVCDGETYGYTFDFDGKPDVWFSSMIFPREYSDKLKELHEVFKKYLAEGEHLPGLVLARTDEPEECRRVPEEGKIVLEVYEYSCGKLYYRLGNGTDEGLEWTDTALYRKGESVPFVSVTEKYPNHSGAHMFDENYLEIPGQLAAGKYRLEAGGYTCKFEVK